MTEKSLRVLYSIGLGIIIVLFVGLGIATFYPAPELSSLANLDTAARQAVIDAHQSALHDYNRNVTIAALASALVILGASIWTESRKPLFAGGFLIGGLLTLIYGLMRGLTSGVTAVAFFSVAVGLFVVVYLGHQRFFSARAVEARARARAEAAHVRMPMQPSYAAVQQPQWPVPSPYTQGQPYQPQPGQYPQPGNYAPQAQPMQQPYPPYPRRREITDSDNAHLCRGLLLPSDALADPRVKVCIPSRLNLKRDGQEAWGGRDDSGRGDGRAGRARGPEGPRGERETR